MGVLGVAPSGGGSMGIALVAVKGASPLEAERFPLFSALPVASRDIIAC